MNLESNWIHHVNGITNNDDLLICFSSVTSMLSPQFTSNSEDIIHTYSDLLHFSFEKSKTSDRVVSQCAVNTIAKLLSSNACTDVIRENFLCEIVLDLNSTVVQYSIFAMSTLLAELLSKKVRPEVNTLSARFLCKNFSSIADKFVTMCLGEEDNFFENAEFDLTMISLINLWEKLEKIIHQSDDLVRLFTISASANDKYSILVDLLTASGRRRSAVLHFRILHLINRALDYPECTKLDNRLLSAIFEENFTNIYVREDFVHVGGVESSLATPARSGDRIMLRLLVIVSLKCLRSSKTAVCELETNIRKLIAFVQSKIYLGSSSLRETLFSLYFEQDDGLIHMLLLVLEIHIDVLTRAEHASVEPFIADTDPSDYFLEFLRRVSFDSGVLLDLIISPETVFLLYIVRFIKYAVKYVRFPGCSISEEEQRMDIKGIADTINQAKYLGKGTTTYCLVPYDSDSDSDEEIVSKSVLEGHVTTYKTNESVKMMTAVSELREKLERLSRNDTLPFGVGPLIRNLKLMEELCFVRK